MTAAVFLFLGAGEEIEDIRPPVVSDPVWVILAILTGLLLAVLLAYLLWPNPKPAVIPPPEPTAWARTKLADLEGRLAKLSAYGTSIEASDILREYVMRRYGLRATQQTTPEFLASILPHPSFTPPLRELLADFLGACDQIKYARVDPGVEASENLLEQARAFIDQVS
ncbi:MAG: hypothetical protein JO015_01540 [Verrucomicrobia bacterium]|nr:hypothetical protein [Verrucomicrobiota bacterium]